MVRQMPSANRVPLDPAVAAAEAEASLDRLGKEPPLREREPLSSSLPVISRLMWRSVSGWDCQ